jgi:hypothetical protein
MVLVSLSLQSPQLSIHTLQKEKKRCLCVVQRYNVHTKFQANWSTGLAAQTEGHMSQRSCGSLFPCLERKQCLKYKHKKIFRGIRSVDGDS